MPYPLLFSLSKSCEEFLPIGRVEIDLFDLGGQLAFFGLWPHFP
jgi:hypothetical protein